MHNKRMHLDRENADPTLSEFSPGEGWRWATED
jgi:hypothetical protein